VTDRPSGSGLFAWLTLATVCVQFGSLLDDNAGGKLDNTGMNAVSNKDKAGRTRLYNRPIRTKQVGHVFITVQSGESK